MSKASAKADKPLRDAILAALQSEVSDQQGGKAKRLTVIADVLVGLAADGNLAAIREICDRIDGKASCAGAADDKDNVLLDVTVIKDALAKKLARLANP